MLLDTLLAGLKSKSRKALAAKGAARIGAMNQFLRRMAGAVGVPQMAEALKIKPSELKNAIKNAAGKFTWFDPETASPAAKWVKAENLPDGATCKLIGTPVTKADGDYQLAQGSLCDFECVITSHRRDRDGDVLDPKGAVVDPKMPLLWQHIPVAPIGKLLAITDQSDERVAGRFMIASTAMGNDAAVLVEADCLRISHGFAPIEYNPLKDDQGKDLGGWRITKYAMMETSLVSIPSNVDAEITAFSRGKLHHPLVKSWAKVLSDSRTKIVPASDGSATANATIDALKHVTLTINLKGFPGVKAEGDEDEDDDEEGKGKKEDPPKNEDDTDDDEGKGKKGDDDNGDNDDDGDDGDQKEMRALGEIIDAVKEMAGDESLPKEAQRRMATVCGMFEDVEEGIGKSADAIATAAKSRDLAGMFTAMSELTETCSAFIGRAAEELERVGTVNGLSDSAKESIGAVVEEAKGIAAAVGALTGRDFDGDDDEDDNEDLDGKEGEDDEDDEDDTEGKEGEMGQGDEDDDDEDDDQKADDDEDDDDDDDQKADDDDDTEEKADNDDDDDKSSDDDPDPGADNPEAEVSGEANPGITTGRGANPKVRRRLDKILGKRLLGQDLTADERELLKQNRR